MLQSKENIRALIFALRENRDGLRSFAMRRLANLGAPAVPELITALKTPDDGVQESVAVVLRSGTASPGAHDAHGAGSPDVSCGTARPRRARRPG